MASAGRVGDRARVPADSHGGTCCPHAATGPATAGSPDTLINWKPALRVGDRGTHGSCCGPGTWIAGEGNPTVLINDRPVHRKGDVTVHCGGYGVLIEGSPDVWACGDADGACGDVDEPRYKLPVRVTIAGTDEPLAGEAYQVLDQEGNVVREGVLDDDGCLDELDIDLGQYTVCLKNGLILHGR